MWTAGGSNALLAPLTPTTPMPWRGSNHVTTTGWRAAVSRRMVEELWVSGLPKRPSRGERRQATYPQRGRLRETAAGGFRLWLELRDGASSAAMGSVGGKTLEECAAHTACHGAQIERSRDCSLHELDQVEAWHWCAWKIRSAAPLCPAYCAASAAGHHGCARAC
jgi:hypothetical protein